MRGNQHQTTEFEKLYARAVEKKDKRIQFILERRAGIPNTDYLAKQTLDVRNRIMDEGTILIHDDLYGEFRWMHYSIFADFYRNELKEFRRELQTYRREVDTKTRQLCMSMAIWSPSEALSIWLGSVPPDNADIIAWAQRNKRLSRFAVEVLKRWDFIERALKAGKLSDPVEPSKFIQWSAGIKLSSPNEFARYLPVTAEQIASSSDAESLSGIMVFSDRAFGS